ncbi:MAG TPA: Mur ligase domain-containing protein, partial [Thermoanaerobaculia bacterium]|nr:Mur ligase domain-containing protein [Thermoanaerobaculia bacterium]
MPTLTFSQLAEMIGGTVIQGGDAVTSSVIIDSREIKPRAVFFAVKGERLDGHDFVAQALEKGAVGAVVSRVPEGVDKPLIRVDDTIRALQA